MTTADNICDALDAKPTVGVTNCALRPERDAAQEKCWKDIRNTGLLGVVLWKGRRTGAPAAYTVGTWLGVESWSDCQRTGGTALEPRPRDFDCHKKIREERIREKARYISIVMLFFSSNGQQFPIVACSV